MTTKMQLEWRRNKVLELLSKGNSQTDISNVLQVDLSIISRDVSYLREQSKQNIRKYIDERLPEEYEKCLTGLNAILRESWNMSNQSDVDKREKVQALSLAKECYSMKLEILTNATVVDDAMKFINNQKQNLHSDLQKQINGSTNTDTIITTDVTIQEEKEEETAIMNDETF